MTVEDGTGIAGADSYVSVPFADDYFSARGNAAWGELSDEQKEQALVRATDYVDNVFQWRGKKESVAQPLRFPRTGITDYEGAEVRGIPSVLMQAVCEAALACSDGTALFQTEDANGMVTSERIGELSFSYSRPEGSSERWNTLYDSINLRLRGLYVDASRKRIQSGRVLR